MGVFFSNFSCDTSGLFFSVKLCVFSVKLRVIAPDALVITQRATKEAQRHTDFLAKHSHEKLLSLLYLFHIPTFPHSFIGLKPRVIQFHCFFQVNGAGVGVDFCG